jgi:hypothetical protein
VERDKLNYYYEKSRFMCYWKELMAGEELERKAKK